MEIDLLILVQRLERLPGLRLGEARVVKARPVARPAEAREFDPFQFVGGDPAGGDVEDFDRAPVGAAVLDRIKKMPAVFARHPFGERGGTVLRPAVGIDQRPPLAIDAIAHEQHRLVLQPVVAGVEIMPALLHRHAEPLIVIELGHARLERRAQRQRCQEFVGRDVFDIDPRAHFGIVADVIFEPAIGIGDGDAELLLDQVHAAGGRVGHDRLARDLD